MKAGIKSILKDLIKNWVFWVLIVTGFAIFIRSIPAWTNYGWGCDLGIYLGIAEKYVTTGELFSTYTGWGSSYNYFPVLYAITGFISQITGLDISVVMPKIGPIFGGLTILLFFFVVKELTGNKKIALLSSIILAVLPFHVYQTSHTYPLTIGHFFMMFSILFFLKYRRNMWYIFPLLISTVLLIMSHHLTTYFYLLSIIMIVFVENAIRHKWTNHLKKDIAYILFASGLIFSYWAFIAIPVYDSFMRNSIIIGSIEMGNNSTIFLFYILFFSSFLLIWLKRKFNIFIEKSEPTIKKSIERFLIIFTMGISIMTLFYFIKLPSVNFSLNLETIFLSIPLLIVFSFMGAGFRFTYFIKNGAFIRGWFFAISFSLVISLVFNIRPLFPHRHFDYLEIPLSIIAAYGIRNIFLKYDYAELFSKIKHIFKIKTPKFQKTNLRKTFLNKNILYFSFIFFIITANAFSVYNLHETIGQSHEEISSREFSTIQNWMVENLNMNDTVIASDHRLERIAESAGFNTTKDETYYLWESEDIEESILELYGIGRNYSRITHIIIGSTMLEKQVHLGFQKKGPISVIMSEESYDKFKSSFFTLIHVNQSEEIDEETGDPFKWVEVYKVNWDVIADYVGSKKQ